MSTTVTNTLMEPWNELADLVWEQSVDSSEGCTTTARIYLGPEQAARRKELPHENLGVVTATTTISPPFVQTNGRIRFCQVPILDEEEADLLLYLPGTTYFIHSCLYNDTQHHDQQHTTTTVLVHCQFGVSRSASIVLAYLMKYHDFSLTQALDHVRQRRLIIDPNPGFRRQLATWEQGGWGIQ